MTSPVLDSSHGPTADPDVAARSGPPRGPALGRGKPRRTSLAALFAAGVAATVLVAGCAGKSPDQRVSPGPTPPVVVAPPVMTTAEAGRVLDNYERVNATANRTFDARLLSTVEGGALFELSRAAYRQRPAPSDANQALPDPGYTYVDRDFLLPAGTSWFAVSARTRDETGALSNSRVLAVFDRDAQGSWKAVASCWLDPAALPAPARSADARPVAVTETAAVRGALAPDALAGAATDLYATGGREGGTVFDDGPVATSMRQMPALQNQALAPNGRAEFQAGQTGHRTVYAMATADGGTLAVFNSAVRENDHVVSPPAMLYPSPQMEPYVGKFGASAFGIDHLQQSCAYIPVRGQVRLLASRFRITGVQVPRPADAR
jgi:hypothetical protein